MSHGRKQWYRSAQAHVFNLFMYARMESFRFLQILTPRPFSVKEQIRLWSKCTKKLGALSYVSTCAFGCSFLLFVVVAFVCFNISNNTAI